MRQILRSARSATLGVFRPSVSAALHRGDEERLPRLPGVRELAWSTDLLEYACGRVAGHVVEVAGGLDLGPSPDVAAHRLDRLHLGARAPDEAGPLGPEPADVDVDVGAVRRVEE